MGDLDPTSYYKGEDGGLDAADIAGIVIGITLGIPMLMAVGWGFLICYRRRIAPKRSGTAKPESNAEVAHRIEADFAIDPADLERRKDEGEEGEEHKEVIEMEPITRVITATSSTTAPPTIISTHTTTTTTTTPVGNDSHTPDDSPDSASIDDATNRV